MSIPRKENPRISSWASERGAPFDGSALPPLMAVCLIRRWCNGATVAVDRCYCFIRAPGDHIQFNLSSTRSRYTCSANVN